MAFGRLARTTGPAPMSDINMTPLIDVMLVLLVIFIITAPLMTSSLKLDLPKADAATPTTAPSFIGVAIDSAGKLYFGEEVLSRDQLAQRVNAAAKANRELEVQLRADQKVPYGQVADLIALVQQAGLTRIGFVTEAPAPR
ncbi:MAG: biopolymer transporter ExbD [Aquincola sp.]|nr:biopolymer transporter ExbD [Aquincola sp.]MDH4288005.1 biopolymer transporter ExbD [Aquincola sp.]MDH5330276.1 biopolymer transporter ExbD [Aquincola sp.]